MVTAFDFFDRKNQIRASNIRELIMDQKGILDYVTTQMRKAKSFVQLNENQLIEIKEMGHKLNDSANNF